VNLLSSLPRTDGFRFTGVRHNGSLVDLVRKGDEPAFVAGTEETDLCECWVMNAELAGWKPATPTVDDATTHNQS
jgi:hypothetical protein